MFDTVLQLRYDLATNSNMPHRPKRPWSPCQQSCASLTLRTVAHTLSWYNTGYKHPLPHFCLADSHPSREQPRVQDSEPIYDILLIGSRLPIGIVLRQDIRGATSFLGCHVAGPCKYLVRSVAA